MRIKHFPIVFKLVIFITISLCVVAVGISWNNSLLFHEISTDREESNNTNTAESKSLLLETYIQSYMEKLAGYAFQNLKNSDQINENFISDTEFLGFSLETNNGEELKKSNLLKEGNNTDQIKNTEIIQIKSKLSEMEKNNSLIYSGKVLIVNQSKNFPYPIFFLGMPLTRNEKNEITGIAWGIIKLDKMAVALSSIAGRELIVTDSFAHALIHPDDKKILEVVDISKHELIKDALLSETNIKQKYFGINNKFLGAYSKNKFGLITLSIIPTQVILGPSELIKANSYYVLGIILSLSLIFIFIFSQHITSPIEKLEDLTHEIARGNFDVKASDSIKTKDEVGTLAIAFDQMTIGLKEREKMKNVFNKFHGTAITEELLKSELVRGGKSSEATVFFSDIRGFTDFSEGHTPEEVVLMLNEYFDVMVAIINKHGGVVDKFIGDAIMAVWGAPNKSTNDEENAVMACLEMRIALYHLNDQRILKSLPPIVIGIGLHSGHVVSGAIGSSERMEYTVIGDTVNTASRIEASTKSFGSDLLISEETQSRLSDKFITEIAGKVQVQGKAEALTLYKVNGYVDENGVNQIIETQYSSYQAGSDKKVRMAV